MEEIELEIDTKGNKKQMKAFEILLDNNSKVREL